MSKELKALEKLKQNNKDNAHLFDDELLSIIEPALNALEIIKEKRVNIDLLLVCFTTKQPLKNYNKSLLAYNSGKLTEVEFDTLKEVLL